MSKNVNEVIEALKNKAKENRDKNNQVDIFTFHKIKSTF